MQELVTIAEQISVELTRRKQTIAVAESSAGGLISAALLAVPGASAYFLGSAVVYTRDARRILMDISDDEMRANRFRSSSEPYAELLAQRIRERFDCVWGLSETGAAGPGGNRYGDDAGHSCCAISGPMQAVMTLETGKSDRLGNMHVFAGTAMTFLLNHLKQLP